MGYHYHPNSVNLVAEKLNQILEANLHADFSTPPGEEKTFAWYLRQGIAVAKELKIEPYGSMSVTVTIPGPTQVSVRPLEGRQKSAADIIASAVPVEDKPSLMETEERTIWEVITFLMTATPGAYEFPLVLGVGEQEQKDLQDWCEGEWTVVTWEPLVIRSV